MFRFGAFRLPLALVALLLPALVGSAETPGSRGINAYERDGCPDWSFSLPHHRDVPDGAPCYVVENGTARLVVGKAVGANNGCGSFVPGWLVDFGLTGAWNVENLDWSEWTLQPRMDRKWNHHGRWLKLADVSIDGSSVVARGSWQADPSIRAEARYTLLPGAPVARVALTLRNEGTTDLKAFFEYLIDYDHGGDARAPGGAWNINAVVPAPADNFIFAGRKDGRSTNFGLAWYEDTPSGVLAAGHIAGLWFDASVRAGQTRTLVFYQIVDVGADDPDDRIPGWAHQIPARDPWVEAKAAVTGSLATRGQPVEDAVVYATGRAGRTVTRATTVQGGRYLMYLPVGTYTLQASRLGCEVASLPLQVADVRHRQTLDVNLRPVSGLWAGRGKRLRGPMVQADIKDLVVESDRLAIALATSFENSDLGAATRGKPVDLSAAGMGDTLRWVDTPYVASQPPTGVDAWRQGTVVNRTTAVVAHTPQRVVVRADGAYTADRSLAVITDYTLEPGKPWVSVASTFRNQGHETLEVCVGDVMRVGDEGSVALAWGAGKPAESMLPATIPGAVPWMAQAPQSDQVLGVDYVHQLPGLSFYGSSQWILSRIPLSLAPGRSYVLRRYLICRPSAPARAPELAMAEAHHRLTAELAGLDVSLVAAGTTVRVGEESAVSVRVRNTTAAPSSPVRIRLAGAGRLKVLAGGETEVPLLAPGASTEVTFGVRGDAVGRGRLSAEAVTAWGTVRTAPLAISVDGPGWYQGDCHSHTTHSDGKGQVSDNAAAALRLGLSFLFVTDHNTLAQRAEVEQASQTGFLCLLGEEITSAYGHANALHVAELVPWRGKPQRAVDAVRRQGGVFFINHPHLTGLEWRDWGIEGYDGIEVWNGFAPPQDRVNRLAFRDWDRELNAGKHVVGFANSDAHTPAKVGHPRVCAWLERLTPEDVKASLRAGRFYGTNGPELRFQANGARIGSILRSRPGEPVVLEIEARSSDPLEKVVLIRNGEVLEEWVTDSTETAVTFTDRPTADAWYRVQVTDTEEGFAYTNPIWVEAGG